MILGILILINWSKSFYSVSFSLKLEVVHSLVIFLLAIIDNYDWRLDREGK